MFVLDKNDVGKNLALVDGVELLFELFVQDRCPDVGRHRALADKTRALAISTVVAFRTPAVLFSFTRISIEEIDLPEFPAPLSANVPPRPSDAVRYAKASTSERAWSFRDVWAARSTAITREPRDLAARSIWTPPPPASITSTRFLRVTRALFRTAWCEVSTESEANPVMQGRVRQGPGPDCGMARAHI